jgi:hypothetical protein
MVTLRLGSVVFAAASALFLCLSLHAQSFTFGPVQNINLPSEAVGYQLATLDMNGDGNTDVFVSLSTGNYIYLGDGTGSFSATPVTAHGSAGGSFQHQPQFYDVNGDGYADEVIAYPGYNDPSGTNSYPGVFSILLGDGQGNFTESTQLSQGDSNGSQGILIAGDFNHDGKVDFATAFIQAPNSGQGTLNIFLNKGAGHFQAGLSMTVAGLPGGLVSTDFNGDGKLDILWLDDAPEANRKNAFDFHCLYGNGDGTFRPDKVCYALDSAPQSVASADFNRDGKPDLVIYAGAKLDAHGHVVSGAKPRLATLLAKTGGFYWSSSLTATTGVGTLRIAEMNGDGYPDLIAGNSLFKGSANGVFSNQQIFYNVPRIFAPLRKGGRPAMFYLNVNTNDLSDTVSYQLNTSPK